MRWPVVACALLIAIGCSRAPGPAEIYSQAWSKYQEGRLDEAYKLTSQTLGPGTETSASMDATLPGAEPLLLLHCEILLSQGRASEALPYLDKFPPKDPHLRIRWLVDRAEGLNKLRRRDEATQILDEVDKDIAGSDSVDPYTHFKALMVRTSVLSRLERFEESEVILRKGLDLANAHHSEFERAAALLNLSFSRLGPGQYDEAAEFALQSLEAAERANAGQVIALAEHNLGRSYTVLGDLDRAEEYTNKAIEQLRKIGDLQNLEQTLGDRGNIHLERHQPAEAAQDFQEAYKIAVSIQAMEAANTWAGQVASAFIEERKWGDAESWHSRALDLDRKLHPSQSSPILQLYLAAINAGRGQADEAMRLYRDAAARATGDKFVERTSHIGLARLLKSQNLWEEANREYENSLAIIDRRGERFGPTYIDMRIQSFKEYADLLVSQHRDNRALQVVESSRARTLRERLDLPALNVDQVDLVAFQQYARQSDSVLLSYWLAPHRSFVWIVKPGGIQMRELPGAEKLEPAIRAYRKVIEGSRDPIAQGIPQAKQLSNMLLGPLMDDLTGAARIIVVPDGSLHALNLEALIVPGTNRYWIENAQISIAPSLSILTAAPPAKRSRPSLLLVGAPHSPDPAFPDLPAALSEISAIEKHFPGDNVSVRTGQSATPKSFRQVNPERFSMIHFATHAEANPKSPLDSAVILSQEENRYKLYASEIASLKLSADLVTLSACRSAGARAYGGEGLVGFAWAFLQSGAHSVVAGLWDVGDASSSELMDNLYLEISKGATPASALRQAKLNMLRPGSPYRKPVFWAPFQIFIR